MKLIDNKHWFFSHWNDKEKFGRVFFSSHKFIETTRKNKYHESIKLALDFYLLGSLVVNNTHSNEAIEAIESSGCVFFSLYNYSAKQTTLIEMCIKSLIIHTLKLLCIPVEFQANSTFYFNHILKCISKCFIERFFV